MAKAKECSSNDNSKKIVRLQTSDGEIMEVEEAVASISSLINALIVDVGTDTAIPLSNVSMSILREVIEYCAFYALHDCDFHKQIPEKEKYVDAMRRRQEEEKQEVIKWDDEFAMKMNIATLCELIDATDYLRIRELRDLAARCCGKKLMEKTNKVLHDINLSLSDVLIGKNIDDGTDH